MTAPDPRTALARALAETHLECQAAEHDYRRTIAEGADHMHSRFNAAKLAEQPEALDHWEWHHGAMAETVERAGLQGIPALPFAPV